MITKRLQFGPNVCELEKPVTTENKKYTIGQNSKFKANNLPRKKNRENQNKKENASNCRHPQQCI